MLKKITVFNSQHKPLSSDT